MVVFENVSKLYENPECLAIKEFSLKVDYGEFVILKGRSGSGKTTLLSMIRKEIEPTLGKIYVNGVDLSNIRQKDIPKYRCSIGMVFQDFRLVEDMNAFDNIRLSYMISGGRDKDASRRVSSVMKMLGVDHLHKRLPKEMSGGEQQKICMARAVVNQPRLLIADEPTGNLDPHSSAEIFSLLKIINAQKISVIMATHDNNAIQSINGRVIDLDNY